MSLSVLIIDHTAAADGVADALQTAGYAVRIATDAPIGLDLLKNMPADIVLTNMHLPDGSGLDVMQHVQRIAPSTRVIIMAASHDARQAVTALRQGAADCLIEPLDMDELIVRLERIAETLRLERDLRDARALLSAQAADAMVGESAAFQFVMRQIGLFAPSGAPVLIRGESGTGKELIAGRIHALGPRPTGPFVAVNCAALPETLIESELFGAVRGAYTGATHRRLGRFGAAHEGTLFLDEVAELPQSAQAKLLRVLQSGMIQPLGSDRPMPVDVRIVAATHRDLKARVVAGQFREDLYYRLNVLSLTVPPLRERGGDLLLLTQHFIGRMARHGVLPTLSADAWAALRAWPFPGNIRELQHAIQYAIVMQDGEIRREHLPDDIAGRSAARASPLTWTKATAPAPLEPLGPLRAAARLWERAYLIRALKATGGHRTRTAELLAISRKGLWQKLRKHGLQSLGAGGVDEALASD